MKDEDNSSFYLLPSFHYLYHTLILKYVTLKVVVAFYFLIDLTESSFVAFYFIVIYIYFVAFYFIECKYLPHHDEIN